MLRASFEGPPTLKPIILTTLGGGRPRVNPMHLATWAPHIIESGGKSHLGSKIMFAGVASEVLESAEQIDWLFERATADLDADLLHLVADLSQRLKAKGPDGEPPPG